MQNQWKYKTIITHVIYLVLVLSQVPTPSTSESPDVETTETITDQPPPPPEPQYLPDERPSAIAFGSLGLILITSVVIFFIILDLPTYQDNLRLATKNVKSFVQYRKQLRQDREKSMRAVQIYGVDYAILCSNEKDTNKGVLHNLITESSL